ncbi:unnamed protein product [Rotaria socialis]|uniref:Uncharacterized protein n=1 Tax=Rotaria socialis TaxID=392032 RepID=A0A821A5M5_9BILA|nr:unnamed protein product [Rotaria socialis]CAF4780319.1 unnamed protein product [Rotaria socialis]
MIREKPEQQHKHYLQLIDWNVCFLLDLEIALHINRFLAYLSLGKTHEEAIQAGAYCAFECIQQSGCTFPDKPFFDPTTFVV